MAVTIAEIRKVPTFGTTVSALLELLDWLEELVLSNPAHVKNVPGRKTDVNDAMWLADLLAHGLIRASFVPPQPLQELRALARTHKQFVCERTSQLQRIEICWRTPTSRSLGT
ncbi:IS110 family transposase [Azohydromonas sp. G-1-1-14]|uniref:IS110 family transposase n=1 Tax=Azohydromonas caseinilytica TaxID=2728836 RepID=A0A848FI67_9BURK|nr:IS110 family transposase [Azohydromonas caseinilytica]